MSAARRTAAVLGAAALALLAPVAAAPALAAGERPVAYFNPDTGKDTENPGVDPNSGCDQPAQSDTAPLGDEASGSGNVHVDACLFDGSTKVDVKAAFETTGVGVVTACPDADKEGPKTATKSDTMCLQDGFEADNSEYHVRVTSASAGLQTVRFCADPEGNGCGDAADVSTVRITWGAPAGGVAAGGGLPQDDNRQLVALLALGAAAAAAGAVGTARVRARR